MTNSNAYKIQDVKRKKRLGVVARTLVDLKQRGVKKLGVPEECGVFLEDGTEVGDEEYFQTLPPQTVFVFVRPDETWEGYLTVLKDATEKIFKAMSRRDEIIEQVYDFIHSSESEEMYCMMVELVNRLDDNIDAEERNEDGAWFIGLSQSFYTKEDVMRNAAKSRIRKYFYLSKEFFDKASRKSQPLLTDVLDHFQEQLKKQQHFGHYFARSASPKLRLCCPKGWFSCQGPYNEEDCVKLHKINPYGSKESRVLFSTWNLDHVIERSRQILPAITRAADDCPKGYKLNWKYFFDLLFTRKNIKLVHVGCHIKGEHEGCKCQDRYFYVKSKS